ncbi:MAG: hypothetical protein HKP58_19250 [Desulfatitalea sp.]|nr:enoyl-CoA hydratase/isomerase family protein [Desulfatitalea sp.]NNK02553.1 hypothetical protein [Desulfatitalea sp.]
MEQGRIDTQIRDKVGILTINNPPANALTPELRFAFSAKLNEMVDDDSVWCIVLTGAPGKFFVGGADISKLLDLDHDSAYERMKKGREFYSGIAYCDKPVIAAINGFCLGGGLELALACDLRIAADCAKLGLPEVKLGIIPGAGGTQRLPRAVGPGWANYLLFTGQAISAEKALQIGLVQQVVPAEELMDNTLKVAGMINGNAPLSVRSVKRAAFLGLQGSLEEGLDIELDAFAKICDTADKNEGVSAFLEKRKPDFQCK